MMYDKGKKFFELFGRPCAGTAWNVHAKLVCGHVPRCSASDYFEKVQKSSSMKRRERQERVIRRRVEVEQN